MSEPWTEILQVFPTAWIADAVVLLWKPTPVLACRVLLPGETPSPRLGVLVSFAVTPFRVLDVIAFCRRIGPAESKMSMPLPLFD